jgi:thymidine kinase
MKHETFNVRTSQDIRASVEPDAEVVGIDGGQFFDSELIKIGNEHAACA